MPENQLGITSPVRLWHKIYGSYLYKFRIMKIKTFGSLIIPLFISNTVFSQDTSANQRLSQDQTYQVAAPTNPNNMTGVTNGDSTTNTTNHFYRPTRLGSSSPLYNTYQKNDYGAGAVTTNPNKSGGGTYTPPPTLSSTPVDTNYNNLNVYDTTDIKK